MVIDGRRAGNLGILLKQFAAAGGHAALLDGVLRFEAGLSGAEPLAALREARVLGLSCGDFHCLALVDDGRVYTWGAGAFGEIGHGDAAHACEPRRLHGVRRNSLVFAACGASHNVLLIAAGAAAEGLLPSDDEDGSDAGSSDGGSATTAARTVEQY